MEWPSRLALPTFQMRNLHPSKLCHESDFTIMKRFITRASLLLLLILCSLNWVYGIGKVTIKGKITNYNATQTPTKISITSHDPYEKVYPAIIDDQGNFRVTFPKGFTGEVGFKFNDLKPIPVIVGPSEKQYFKIKPGNKSIIISFSGDNSVVNREIQEFNTARETSWPVVYKYASNPYETRSSNLLKLDYQEILKTETDFLNNYLLAHKVSDQFKHWATNHIKYEYAFIWYQIKTNQHDPIDDPAFFAAYPINNPENLISLYYLRYIKAVLNSNMYWSKAVNTVIVYQENYKREFKSELNSKGKTLFDELLKHSNWLDRDFASNAQLIRSNSNSLLKYRMPRADRFFVEYIETKTTGLISDLLFANYILPASVSDWHNDVTFEYRYPKLLAKYRELVHPKIYYSFIKDEVKRNRK